MSILEQDKIGREEVVDKICGLVDSLEKDKNFCLALNGAWGSGKTFVLDMIAEKLSERQEYIIIKYDAWENNFYPDPLIAILYCILDSLTSNQEFKKFQQDKTLKKRVKKVFSQSFDEAIDKTIDKLYKIGRWAGVVAYAAETIKSIIRVAKISILDNKLFDDFKSYKKLLQDFINVSNKLTEYEKEEGKQTKLIILVDEVDRCLPDEQLKVLERLHHLFGVNNCAVIVALNKEQVTNTYAKICGGDGKEYLRKFFDYNFELSMLNAVFFQNELWDNIVENAELKFVEAISKQQLEFLQQYIFEKIESHFGSKSKIDNRELERIVKHILSVVKSLPNKKVDYSYLLLISYILCCRLYEKNVFADLKYKKINYLLDIFKNSNIESQILSVQKTFVSSINYRIYYNCSLNTVNYYLNKWAIKDEYMKDTEVDRIFLGTTSSDSCYKQNLEIIFKKIDYIAD